MRHKVFASLLFIFVSCGSNFSQNIWDPNTGGINLDILVGSVSSEVNGREMPTLLDDDVEAAAVDQPKLDLTLHLHLGCTTRPLTWTWSGDMEDSLISWGSWTSPVPELLSNFNIVAANALQCFPWKAGSRTFREGDILHEGASLVVRLVSGIHVGYVKLSSSSFEIFLKIIIPPAHRQSYMKIFLILLCLSSEDDSVCFDNWLFWDKERCSHNKALPPKLLQGL